MKDRNPDLSSGDVLISELARAEGIIAAIGDIDPEQISDSVVLAEKMQGLAGAIRDVIDVRGSGEFDLSRALTDPGYVHDRVMLQRFNYPTKGYVFRASGSLFGDVSLDLNKLDQRGGESRGGELGLCGVTIPSDKHIDELLMQEPALWSDSTISAFDNRGDERRGIQPFWNRFHTPGDAGRYFALLQELVKII